MNSNATFAQQTLAHPLRSQRLSQATHAPHEVLDRLVKAQAPFDSIEGFSLFVTAQYLFQAELETLYNNPRLVIHFPDLPSRCRLEQARADLSYLQVELPAAVPGAPAGLSLGESLGWIFVSEGSKLGAAFLLKRAEALGLSPTQGARHLAEPEGGRAAGWKAFVKALDAVALDEREEQLAEAGALAAFERFTVLLQTAFARAQA